MRDWATELRMAGGSDRRASSARKHESRKSSTLMTSPMRLRSAATTRSLKRLLKELAEPIRRDKKSKVDGLGAPFMSAPAQERA